ncbi:alpha-ketoglutarate-dependent dioxygenase AlkB [uncultured Psychroserpens sp.]|uniref:alpha-ketoglutarate-dependent dioxygenase AlkB family protein n=1 Tax=uncultured Psychroserpens sp. TaxID=255436 RepID=UPI0026309A8C|nr:alpha-ketoglutarate-dependent dioxygenase AlkB [uncultured Psychroserpens sp.]
MDLFSEGKTVLKLPNAELIYISNFYNKIKANHYFNYLKAKIEWQQDDITIFGKTYKQPRLTALYAENSASYSYSNITMKPKPFTKELIQLKSDIEKASDHKFTSVLLNRYRNGNDSNGWHADNEKELGKNPIIASLSFGEKRYFHFKHRTIKTERYKLALEHGSLLIMRGDMQHHWLHQIAKTKKQVDERINLTFRRIEHM